MEEVFRKQEGAEKWFREIAEKGAGVDIWRMYENKREVELKVI